eukprot:6107568-Pyramimonas_sp.AAC.1
MRVRKVRRRRITRNNVGRRQMYNKSPILGYGKNYPRSGWSGRTGGTPNSRTHRRTPLHARGQ